MSISVIPNEKPKRTMSEYEYVHNPDSKEGRLGKGSFASVRLVKEKTTGAQLAMKTVDVTLKEASKSDMHNLRMEITVHRELDHPNIVKFHDYLIEEGRVYMLLDYCPRGNLYSFMHKAKTLPLEQVFKFWYQTCLAVNHLHGKDILHRDLKPENLLLDKDLNIKLCDFGWAARSLKDKRTTFCGTYEYMAPELVAKGTYNYKVDIWSLGILLYELFHSEAPYKGRTLQDIQASMARDTIRYNPIIHPELKNLIAFILNRDPELRPELSEILNHPWVHMNLSKMDATFKYVTPNTEVSQQPGQSQSQQPAQSQVCRPQSAGVKDLKRAASSVSTAPSDENSLNSTDPKKLLNMIFNRQASEHYEFVKENVDSKETNNSAMTAGQKLTANLSAKDINKQTSAGYNSPLVEKQFSGLSLAQKTISEGHALQNDSSSLLARSFNLQLARNCVKPTHRGVESDFNTPEKEQKSQESFVQLNMNRSLLQQKNRSGFDKSLPKENMHAYNHSLSGLNASGYNSTRHAYTTSNTESSNYENFSQAVTPFELYNSAKKPSINREFSSSNILREPLSATTKSSSRPDFPSDIQLNKSSFAGKSKRDNGVKLDMQKFYPFGNNSGVNSSPSKVPFEVNSAGLSVNKSAWGQSRINPLHSASYSAFGGKNDSDTKMNFNNSSNNMSYGGLAGVLNFNQASQSPYKNTNSPLVDRHVGKEVREGGYKANRSHTFMDMKSTVKGSFLGL